MKIKKKEGDFNSYSIDDVSYGELVAMEKAMSVKHSDPLSDEVYATLRWYLDELPKPGESKEDDGDGGDGGSGVDDADFDHTPDDAPAGEGESRGFASDDSGDKPEKGGGEDDSTPPAPRPSGTDKPEESADDYLEAPPEPE